MSNRIIFLNVQVFKVLKTSFIIWLAYSIAYLFFHFPYYNVFFFGMIFILIAIFITGIGYISKQKTQGQTVLEFATIFKKQKLIGDIKIEKWWSYDFTEGAQLSMENVGTSKAGSNNIISYLSISDKNENTVLLREAILLDTRFPNESKYSNLPIDKKLPIFDIQRSDKMHERLKYLMKH